MTACPSLVRSGTSRPQSLKTYGDIHSFGPLASTSPPLEPSVKAASLSPGQRDGTAKVNDLGPVGSAARPILAKGAFSNIIVEVQYVEGRYPDPTALEHLVATLHDVSGKSVQLTTAHMLAPKEGPYSVLEIQDLSEKRSTTSSEPTLSIIVMSLDGSLEGAPLAIAASVGATVMAIFPDKIRKITTDPAGIQSATLVHELGHILGLIDIELKSPRPREHPEHPGHSANRRSVMFWAVDRADVAIELGTLPPRDFDDDDLADLRDIAAGRYLRT